MAQVSHRLSSIVPLSLIAGTLAWLAAIELVAEFPMPRAAYIGAGFLGCTALGLWRKRGWTTRRATAALLFVAALAVLHLAPFSSRKTFIVSLRTIEPGMKREAVDALLGAYPFRENRATPTHVERAYRHVDEGRFDSDVGVVTLREDRVVSTQFVPD